MSNTTDAAAGETVKFVFYHYTPSLVAAAIFAVIFFASAFGHVIQIILKRTWYFIPMLIGTLMEAFGYIGRIQSHSDIENLSPYIMQTLLLLVAPALLAASIYMVLGRLMRYLNATHHSLIRINWLTKLFVLGDVLSFLMQGGGGGMMANGTEESAANGEKLVLGGLFVQLFFFSGFIVVAVMFHIRIVKAPSVMASSLQRDGMHGWMTMLKVLYGTSALIMIRSIFRVVEYLQGNTGYLMRTEAWLYVFDAVLISAVVIAFNVVHPSNVILPDVQKGYAERSESLQGLEMESNRSEHGLRR